MSMSGKSMTLAEAVQATEDRANEYLNENRRLLARIAELEGRNPDDGDCGCGEPCSDCGDDPLAEVNRRLDALEAQLNPNESAVPTGECE